VEYELGIDFDNDGAYDYIARGTSTVSADRLRLVFGVTKAMSAASASLTNSYAYTLTDTPVVINSGSGTVSTDDTAGWASKIVFASSIWSADFKTDGTTYGISGTMELSGQSEDTHDNVVFFGAMHNYSTATEVWTVDPKYSANMRISETSWPNNEYRVASAGTQIASDLFPESSADIVYGYAMNLTYSPTNVNYELGIDFDNDGIYDYITNGTSTVSADQLRLVFGVTKAMSATSASLTNSYTYAFSDVPVTIDGGSGPEPDAGYAGWAAGWGVPIGVETNDYDNDGLLNVYEYGLGGDPTNAADQGTAPEFGVVDIGGTNQFRYIHPQLSDPDSGITCSLALRSDLVLGGWETNAGYVITGTNITGGELNFVTNMADTVDGKKFIRLIIE